MRTSLAKFFVPALAAVLAMGTLAVAQGPGGPGDPGGRGGMVMGHGFADHRPPFERAMGDHGRWWSNPRMIAMLKLTDDQRKAMDAIWYQHREKLIDLQAGLEKAELAMEPLMSADQPDQAAMEAQIDKIVTARADLERANAMFLLDIRMKLTPDQWKQLKDMRQKGMDRWRGGMGGGMRGGMINRHGPGQPGQQMWRQHPKGQNGTPPSGAQPGNPPAGQPQGPGSGDQP